MMEDDETLGAVIRATAVALAFVTIVGVLSWVFLG